MEEELKVTLEDVKECHGRVVEVLKRMDAGENNIQVSLSGKDYLIIEYALDGLVNVMRAQTL